MSEAANAHHNDDHEHHEHSEHNEHQPPNPETDLQESPTAQETEVETAVTEAEVAPVLAATSAEPTTEPAVEPSTEVVPETPLKTESQAPVKETVESLVEPELATTEPAEPEHQAQTTGEESLYSGLLAYRKASATFPIYHKRYFYFSDAAIPLENLYAFYQKYKKLKVDKDELDHLVAHAATSGVGLFFYSKAPDTVPSGILECSRMTEIKADEHMSDRFSISYGAKHTFYFETGLSNRAAWVSGISKKKFETAAEIETIRTSATYISNLKALEDGTAFNKIGPVEGTNEVFSDEDENEGTVHTPPVDSPESSAVDKNSERPIGRRASSFLKTLKEKAHHDKATTEVAQEGPEVPEKTPKKDKRRSFMTGFMNKRETSIVPTGESESAPVEATASAPVQELTREHTEAEAKSTAVVEKKTPEKSATNTIGIAKSPLSPFKEKVDGFFSKFKKSHDKDEQVEPICSTENEHVVAAKDSSQVEPAAAQVESPGVANETAGVESSAATEIDVGPHNEQCVANQTVNAASERVVGTSEADVAQNIAPTSRFDTDIEFEEKKPVGLARRLTSLFKGKKPGKHQVPASSVITSDGPPQLPETAIIDSEPEPTPTVEAANVQSEVPAVSDVQQEATCCSQTPQAEAAIVEEKDGGSEPVK